MPTEFVPWTHETTAIVAMAGITATTMKHDWLGTEHIMLTLLRDNVVSCAIQVYLDCDTSEIYLKLMNLTSKQERRVPVRLEPPGLTPGAIKAISLAGWIAKERCASNCIRPMHLFLGILHEEQGVAAQLLAKEFKITYPRVFTKVVNERSLI